ncbi:hypothetical protein F5Y18DRAFT_165129 [Xylariaceae sp. FL1019]|nr:hypothetical protein F5Y18DRAFT_165129 [Xylariaceae sp. FL1019]
MSLHPLWAPSRRLPRSHVTPPPAYAEHPQPIHDRYASDRVEISRMRDTVLPFRSRVNSESHRTNNQFDVGFTDREDQHLRTSRRSSVNHPGTRHSSTSYEVGTIHTEPRSGTSHRPKNDIYSRPEQSKPRVIPQCDVGDCRESRTTGSKYCRVHCCAKDGCLDIRALGTRYCTYHKCSLCGNQVRTGHAYCEEHECPDPFCHRRKKKGLNWCRRHTCRSASCTQPSAQGLRYCSDHSCIASDCEEAALQIGGRWGNYCCCHTCSEDNCLKRISRGAFCSEHECRARACPNPRVWADERGKQMEHDCCKFHTCVQRDCFAPTERIGGLCGLHGRQSRQGEHRTKRAEVELTSREREDVCSATHKCCRDRAKKRSRRKSRSGAEDELLERREGQGSSRYSRRSLTIRIVRVSE